MSYDTEVAFSNDNIPRDEWKLANQIAEWEYRVQADNKEFARLSRKEQRIAIAKDALKWLALGRLRATRGAYLLPEKTKQQETGELTKCHACAIGGLFACAVGTGRTTGDMDDDYDMKMVEALKPYFTAKELRTIEAAFEGFDGFGYETGKADEWGDHNWVSAPVALAKRCHVFNKGIRSPKDRMARILRNIIRNDGKFVP